MGTNSSGVGDATCRQQKQIAGIYQLKGWEKLCSQLYQEPITRIERSAGKLNGYFASLPSHFLLVRRDNTQKPMYRSPYLSRSMGNQLNLVLCSSVSTLSREVCVEFLTKQKLSSLHAQLFY